MKTSHRAALRDNGRARLIETLNLRTYHSAQIMSMRWTDDSAHDYILSFRPGEYHCQVRKYGE